MKNKTAVVLALAICAGFAGSAKGETIGTTSYQGKTYYVDVIPSGSKAVVWFRVQRYACSKGDFRVGTISRSSIPVKKNVTLKSVASTVCTVKELYDNGKTIAGCAATIGSAACLAASAPVGGLTAVLCVASIDYAIGKGAKDCFFGVSNKVAEWLAGERNWAAFATGYKVGRKQWGDAIDHAIDLACVFAK